MLCQVCAFANSDEAEYCRKCQHKLLVLSGPAAVEESLNEESDEGFSIEEHLLERISILEEVLRRTGETVRTVLGALQKQEESILVNHAGLQSLRDLLEEGSALSASDWTDRWEGRIEAQLLALEQRDRFVAMRDRILALYGGAKRPLFERLVREAEQAFFRNEIKIALRALEQAFRLDRANYELALFLGESYFHDGALDLALSRFERLLEVKPDHYEALVYSGVIAQQTGRDERAATLLLRAVSRYPDSFLPHFALAATHAGNGNLARAVALLERAVEIDPVPQAYYLLGRCSYEMGSLQRAIRALNEAVRLDPTLEESYHLLGLCYLDRQWNRKALEAFKRAQSLNPRRLRYEDLVSYLSGRGAPFPEVLPAARSWVEEAERSLAAGRTQLALRCYRRALDEQSDHPVLLMSYALICLQLGRSHEIRSVTQRVLDSEDASEMLRTTAYATLIAALRREGNYREGNNVGHRLLREGSSDFSRSVAYYEMAYNFAEMEESLDEALEMARRSLDHAPEELRQFPLAALGWVHYKRQEFEQAIDCLSRSTELGPNETTMTHLGMALLASGEEERARRVLADARALAPGSGALEERVIELMKDSAQIVRRAERKR
jgi:tetratricopeptide (TPR) repeat protein